MKTVLETIYEDRELIIEDKMDIVLRKLESLEKKIIRLEDKLNDNSDNCKKMSDHIDFIESVYTGLKSPLEYMRYKLGFSESKQLPTP